MSQIWSIYKYFIYKCHICEHGDIIFCITIYLHIYIYHELIQLFYVLYTNYIDLGNSFLSRYSTAEYHVHIILLYTQWCKLKLACQTIERLRETNVRLYKYEVYQLRLAGIFIFAPYFVIWYQLLSILKC